MKRLVTASGCHEQPDVSLVLLPFTKIRKKGNFVQSLGISLSSVGLLLLVLLQSTTVTAGTFETGTVTLATTSSASGFTTINFQHTFAHTPLVFMLPSQAGEEPCAIRVRYVTKVSFEAACIEPAGANGPHTAMTVAYFAAEEGVYALDHGHALAVLAVHVYAVQKSLFPDAQPLHKGWEKVQYGDLELPFTIPPAVLTQLQTMHNERGQVPSMPSRPWLTVAVRHLTTTRLDIALERSQVDDGEVLYPEKVGILLASRTHGALTLQDRQGALITYEAARTGKAIQGWDNGCFLYNFRAMFSSSPVVLASINSHRDTDGGWLRRCALTAQYVGLRVDEDQDGDLERLHAAEIAGLLAFSQAFVSPDLPSRPLAVLPTDTGWTVVRSGPGLPTGNFAKRELFMALSEIPAEQESETPGVHGIAFMLHGYLAIPWAKQTFYNGGIALYDIRNPYNPVLVHNLHHEGIRKNRSIGLQARGALHVIIPATYGIQTWDWTDTTRPRMLADLPLPDIEPTGYNNGLWWLFYQAPYVYASGTNLGLYIIDVSDMANPILRKRIPISELGGFRLGTIKIIGNLMYISRNSGVGSASLDVSDPLQPTLLSVERSDKHYSHIVNGNRLYFANKNPEAGLTVVDVRTPTHPQVVNTLPLPAPGGYMTLQDGFLHFGASEAGYLKIAVKKSHQLQIVGNYQFPITDPDIDHVLVAGHLAIASGDNPGNGTRLIPHARFPDTTGPQVSMVFPPPGSTNVPLSTRIGMTFTDQIDILTANHKTVIVRPLGGEPLAGTVSGTQDVLNFTPDMPLLPNRTYQVCVLADGLQDYAGNPVATFTALFSTGDRVDQGITCTLPPPGVSHAGTTATFVATDCFGPEKAFSYAWDFGDGTPPTAFASHAEISHTYTMPGHYVVTLTISNGVGQSTLALPHTVIYPPTALQATHSSSIVYDASRQRVWNVNPDNDTITAIDAQSLNKIAEVPVGQEPTTLALDAEGNIWVSNAKDDNVMILDGQGELLDTILLPFASHPYGLAFDAAHTTAYVTLEAAGQLASVDPGTRMLRSVTPVGPWVRHLAITGDGQRAFLGRFIAPQEHGEVYEVELTGGQPHLVRVIPLQADLGPDSESGSRGIPNYLGALAISPDGRQVWIPSKKDNTARGLWRDGLPLTFETTVRAIMSQIAVASSVEDVAARRDLDDRSLPSAVVFSRFGDYAFVTTLTSNTVEILDAYTGETYAGIDNVGLAPRGLALDPTANRLFIHNFLSRTVAVYDISALGQSNHFSRVAEINVVEHEKLPPQVLYGKQIFYNASDPRMSADQYLSCAACHLDGNSDGRVWDFTDRGEGLRNTPSLQGRQGEAHGLLHWSANFDEIQDFENDIRTAFSGIGFLSDPDFTTGTRAQPLGDPKEGLSAELDALAAYVRSLRDLPPGPLAPPDGSLSPAAFRGQALFFSPLTGCAACHPQPEFTDSELTFSLPLVHDVGTLTAASGSRLGAALPGIDTPTLRGVWQTAPYLHDGSAPTLLDVLTTSNPNDRHGITSGLTESQLEDLITFLQELR